MIMCMNKIYLLILIILSACTNLYQGDELPNLKTKTSEQVLNLLGKPVSERKEGNFKMWAYRQSDCSTLVFFNQDEVVQYAEQRGQCIVEPEN